MPFTSKSFIPINRMGKKAAAPFDPGQVEDISTPGQPTAFGNNAADNSPAVTDPGSTQDVPTFTTPTGPLSSPGIPSPLDASPSGFVVIAVDGDQGGSMDATSASGSAAGTDGTSGTDTPAVTFDQFGASDTGHPEVH